MNRRAIMGIGTLIIFIATILVAAVAAGVIISTSGVLQQKALLIGEQSRNRLINGIQITHVFMKGDTENKTANNIEILSRPEPASGPINFKTTYLSFFTDTGAYSASLSHRQMIDKSFTLSVDVDASSYIAFGDINDDGINDQITLVEDGGAANDYLRVNISNESSLSNLIPLGIDINTGGQSITIIDLPIFFNETIYGYIRINDSSTTADQIDAGTIVITDEIYGGCNFYKLRPETRFCVVTLTGVDDTALEYGETVFIYFKLRTEHILHENDEFEIKLFPQDGRSTYILDRVPQVIYKVRMNVYP